MSAQVSILQLPAAGAITGTEAVPVVQNGVTVQTTTGAIANSPTQTYTYLTVNQTPQLPNSRYVGVTNGLSITDGGAQGLFNITTTGALLSLVGSGTGFQVKTSSTAITGRSIATSGVGLSTANGDGIAGNPTITLAGQVLNLANLSANGLMTITTAGALSATQIANVANQTVVLNPNGTTGYPTIGLADNPIIPGTGSITVPNGTSGQRTGSFGAFRYNTSLSQFEGYTSTGWNQFTLTGNVTSFSAGTTGFSPSSDTSGAVTLSGILNVANGGTGTATPALVAGTNVTITGTWPNQTINASVSGGTVTSVTATSPVVSSGGTTPNISMPAATGSVNGYLTSADWTTFNNKGSGTVTSVTGTSPVVSSGGATPAISMPAATGSVNGYLTSADWTTFNNKGSGTVTSVTGTSPVVSSGGATPDISMPAATTSVNGYLTSADWNTFNGKGSGSVTSVSATVPSFLSVTGSPITTSGTLAIALASTPTNGQLLIGNGTGFSYATLTAGSNITITNSSGGITIASSGGASSPIPKLQSWSIGGF